jgi:hypothetical protein
MQTNENKFRHYQLLCIIDTLLIRMPWEPEIKVSDSISELK